MFYKKESFLILSFTLVIGFLFVSPIFGIWKHFSDNNSVFVLSQLKTYRDELYSYIPRAREIYDGHFPPSDLSLDSSKPTPFNSIPSLMFSFFIWIFKGDITLAYILAQFIFGGVIFVLFYLFGKILFNSKKWSVLFSLIAVLTPFLTNVFNFDFKGDLKVLFDFTFKQFLPFVRSQMDRIRMSRIDEPLLTYPVYISAMVSFVYFWLKPSKFKAVTAGLFAGLLAYTYAHHWIYWSIFIGTIFIYVLFKRVKYYELLKNYLLLFFVFLIICVPYFINFFRFRSLTKSDPSLAFRFTVFHERSLGISVGVLTDYITYIILAILSWIVFIKWEFVRNKISRLHKLGPVFIVMILSIIFARNIQLILGQTITPSKWDNAVAVSLYVISFALLYSFCLYIADKKNLYKNIISFVIIFLSVCVTTKYTFNSVVIFLNPQESLVGSYKFPKNINDSFGWINTNMPKESKIITPSYVSSVYLMSYTSARPYVPRGFLSSAPTKDIENRFLIANKLFLVSPEFLNSMLRDGGADLNCEELSCFPDTGINLGKTYFNMYGGSYQNRSLQDYLNGIEPSVEPKRKELMDSYTTIEPKWNIVDTDFAYYGPWEKQLNGGNKINSTVNNLKLIYKDSSVEIYKINK